MSQILDALRRAEAQRSRGRVPGLHQTANPILPPSGQPRAVQRRPLAIWVAVLLGILALVALWILLGRPVQTRSSPESLPAARDRASASADSKASVAAEVDRGLSGRQTAVGSPPGAPVDVALPRKAQLPERRSEAKESAGKPVAERVERPAANAPSVDTQSLPKSALAIPNRQDLAADIQRSLPPITVSGSVYSSDPAQRMLVVNGELWHEGEQIRPGLVLEQIRRRDAVLRYNGVRFIVVP